MQFQMRSLFKRVLPSVIRGTLREYWELPASARACWRAAFVRRTLRGHDITQLPAQLPDEPRVLVLCYGNIYRSPYARALLELALAKRPELRIAHSSAGLIQTHNRSSPDDAQALASLRGIDLSGHRSRSVTSEDVASADVILIMDRRNEALLAERHPESVGKVVLLGSFDPLAPLLGPTIADPYDRGEEALADCFDRLERSVMRFVEALGGRLPPRPRSRMKRAAVRAGTSALFAPVWRPFANDAAAILMLHRFEDREAGIAGHSAELLRRHLEYLRAERFNIVGLDELIGRTLAGEPLPARAVVITVDDGYTDFARVGMPLFASYDVPVTLFATTRFLDGDHWQWYDAVSHLCATRTRLDITLDVGSERVGIAFRNPPERLRAVRNAVEQLKQHPQTLIRAQLVALQGAVQSELPARPTPRFSAIRWSDLDGLGRLGARFGGHTETHVNLNRESSTVAEKEIRDSVSRIRSGTQYASQVFAYPYGLARDFGAREEQMVAAAGCVAAVAASGGHCTAAEIEARRFAVSRIPYSDDLYAMRQSLIGLERARALAMGGRE